MSGAAEARVLVHRDAQALARSAAKRVEDALEDALEARETVHFCITGGTIGVRVLAELAQLQNVGEPADRLNWDRIHIWWGDERFVPADSPDRNDGQARAALIDVLALPEQNLHPFPSADQGLQLDDAAAAFAQTLARYGTAASPAAPVFDLQLLGVGPDGHIDSLFPGRPELEETVATVLPVRDSPKPPPARLTLTYPVVNAARRTWLVLSGAEKGEALARGLRDGDRRRTPFAGASGTEETLILTDAAAAAQLPEGRAESVEDD